MGNAVGIDLGTTYSAIAHIGPDGAPVVLPDPTGDTITPSVVAFHEGQVKVGRLAKDLQAQGFQDVAAFFKREMGVPDYVFHAAGQDHTAVDLSACVLAHLKRQAEVVLGGAVTDAVITVPAYFKHPQREATMDAGRKAGLNVLQVINEPTAAAIAFGFRHARNRQRLLVYDLGGGTFDVTLLEVGPREVKVLTSDGDHELGGKDWDDRIVEFLVTRFQEQFGEDPLQDSIFVGDLLVQVEQAKRALSGRQSTVVSVSYGGRAGRYTLERATFEQITSDLMERTIALTFKALSDTGLGPSNVDGVLLVGGSTRMPMVKDFVTRRFGRPPIGGVNVDEAVALGAALVAEERSRPRTFGLAGAVKTTDVTNHSLGMIALDEAGTAYTNSIILAKNTPIPCTASRPFQHRTRARGPNRLEVYVTQGESSRPSEVTFLDRYVLEDIPHQSSGLSVLDIQYGYDVSGVVQVSATDRSSGRPVPVRVEPSPPDVPGRFCRPPVMEAKAEPVTVYVCVDLSGSMSGDPLEEAQHAARGFLGNLDLRTCSMGIVAVADRCTTVVEATQDAGAIEDGIRALTIGMVGWGNSAQPFTDGRRLLSSVEGKRFLVVLADGIWADQDTAVEEARRCHREGIEVIAIGFGAADERFLKSVASSDSNSLLTSMGNLVEAFSTIAQVITESGSGALTRPDGPERKGLLQRLVKG